MTEIRYKILDSVNGRYVELISISAIPIYSPFGKTFFTYGDALGYLVKTQRDCMAVRRYLNLSRFKIQELHLIPYNTSEVYDGIEDSIMNDPDSDDKHEWLKAILSQAVLDGFGIIKPALLNFVLTYDKYQPMLSELVPPHMIQCIDEFKTVGIQGCDLDLLGSISLTASEKQLNMYDIDGLFKRRKENASK
ncbi:hypothetical protein GAP32_179 [Cronobacter phage vB_CsaM_GAP32]|uniref:Uncharacterized protein n=1 Tax=Cronobacter phage vB_CsaM_GAP32 TaxID=1141136 RepID=K4FB30_9CAUD|nr:hypothetical protein GAP32_179 [Cronobacter phage vB_CsaM_GAP32]AFC21629.1 hypothetical protein GAP32_179 [Cronobacter phage vB_CsaM_GAP32]